MAKRFTDGVIPELANMTNVPTDAVGDDLDGNPVLRCRECGCTGCELIETPDLTHYGKYACFECGTFIQWARKPNGKKKRQNKRLRPDIIYCECCLRPKEALPDGCVLTEHHVLEYQDYPQFDDDPSNRWVLCSDCHKFIHFVRRFAGRYDEMV